MGKELKEGSSFFCGNIFKILNMNKSNPYTQIGSFFRHISHPARIKILLEIGEGEACVCHLEAKLGLRQAYLSQHLMALRDADILVTEKDGRYVYYRLADPAILDLVRSAAQMIDIDGDQLASTTGSARHCTCPKCSGEA
jgi:ArsR family transcriptional regulator